MSRALGSFAENFACHYLETQGLTLIARNFSCLCGEIDLIMKENKQLVFVEVRYRKQNKFGKAIETITRNKQVKLLRTATYYLKKSNLLRRVPVRFDVIALTEPLEISNIQWIKDAFPNH